MDRFIPEGWDEWKIISLIGGGTFGTVYLAEQETGGGKVRKAVKVIDIPSDEDEILKLKDEFPSEEALRIYYKDIMQDYMEEIRIMDRLKGEPNIVSIDDYISEEKKGTIGWTIYIRMEYLKNLREYFSKENISPQDILKMGIDVCKALESCAKHHIIHLDIKPDNIFVTEDGTFKLGVFGVSQQMERTLSNGSAKGTYYYMSPEIYHGGKYGVTADIYSLGMVLYKLFNRNRDPFLNVDQQIIYYKDRDQAMMRRMRGEALPAPVDAPPVVEEVIQKATSFHQGSRYRSAKDFRQALESALRRIEQGKTDKHTGVIKRICRPAAAAAAVSVILGSSLLFTHLDPEGLLSEHTEMSDNKTQPDGTLAENKPSEDDNNVNIKDDKGGSPDDEVLAHAPVSKGQTDTGLRGIHESLPSSAVPVYSYNDDRGDLVPVYDNQDTSPVRYASAGEPELTDGGSSDAMDGAPDASSGSSGTPGGDSGSQGGSSGTSGGGSGSQGGSSGTSGGGSGSQGGSSASGGGNSGSSGGASNTSPSSHGSENDSGQNENTDTVTGLFSYPSKLKVQVGEEKTITFKEKSGTTTQCQELSIVGSGFADIEPVTWNYYEKEDRNITVKGKEAGSCEVNLVVDVYSDANNTYDLIGKERVKCLVEVVESEEKRPLTAFGLEASRLYMEKGEKQYLRVNYAPLDTTDSTKVSWTSSNESVVKVYDGEIVALNTGSAYVYATMNGMERSCEVTVYAPSFDFYNKIDDIRKISGIKDSLSPNDRMEKLARKIALEKWRDYYNYFEKPNADDPRKQWWESYKNEYPELCAVNIYFGNPSIKDVLMNWSVEGSNFDPKAADNLYNRKAKSIGAACYREGLRSCWVMCLGK